MRFFGTLIVLIAIAAGVIYFTYGSLEPCHVLAREYQMRGINDEALLGLIEYDAQDIYSNETSGYPVMECVGRLVESWGQRIAG